MPHLRPSSAAPSWLVPFLLVTLFLLLCGMRLIHLGADTPLGISRNVGLYVDEGYKTLAPRNLILLGDAKVHPEDDYEGWFHGSPLTQWAFYAAFKTGGVSLESARVVSILAFSLFLAAFLLTMRSRLPPGQLILGLLLLGTQSTMFFFSRVALFEIFVIALLYIPLLASLGWKISDTAKLAFFGLFGIGAVFLIKASSIIYFLPAFIGSGCAYRFKTRRAFWLLATATAVVGFVFFSIFGEELTRRVSWAGVSLRVFHFPLAEAAPVVVIAGYFCALTGLLFKPATFGAGLYRRSLLAIILLAPVLLALFPYNPLRYYIPILPAFILLISEWVKSRGWEKEAGPGLSTGQLLIIAAFSLQTFYQVLQAANLYVLESLPFAIGGDPGISPRNAMKLFLPVALGLSVMLLWRWQAKFAGKRAFACFIAILIGFTAFNGYRLGAFFTRPSYASSEVRRALHRIIPENAVIAGDWAPFLTFNTSLRSIYLNDVFNREKIMAIRPNYFLFSENKNSHESLDSLLNDPRITLDAPLLLPGYFHSDLHLYPIHYKDDSAPESVVVRKNDHR